MSKAKLSTLVAKQFPEFVRDDYPTFIAFIEAYYEFLEQGSYDLSQIRDIDQTLDIFVEYFKSELAANMPNVLVDQRKLLQHLKDQYLSKGTESSYKLLFRLLYDKEVSVKYPGQQMLRASDGRWSQDVTIFARVKRGEPSMVLGQIIEVITPTKTVNIRIDNWRWATVYNNGIASVSDTVVELFIDRKFYGTISYDYIIKYGNVFEATILPTTPNVKIVTRGAGFKAGQLYRIKSALGDGSVLKISRVTETGGIQSAQLIKFGVGYQTDFTTTISPPAAETFTPLTIIGDNINVNDKTGGFVETGLITQNDYTTDAWISTYNGKVLREFYYDDAQVPDPENAAQLKVTLGALAKYPGYYTSNLGFLDDAIYVQDGHYYQAFSYELKIDERISKYKDVVKTLLHPAGMALFGGYELKNELNVTPEIISILAFLAYKFETFMDAPTDEISTKGFGKALDEIQVVLESISSKGLEKSLSDTLDEPVDASVLLISKPVLDIIPEPTDTNTKNFGKSLVETANTSDVLTKRDFGKKLTETVLNEDLLSSIVNKPLIDSISSPTDAYSSLLSKKFEESFALSDSPITIFGKNVVEIVYSSEIIDTISITKPLSEVATFTEIPNITISKSFVDGVTITDEITEIAPEFAVGDTLNTPTDSISTIGVSKSIVDSALASESLGVSLSQAAKQDSISQTDTSVFSINKGISDSAVPSETGFVEFNPYIAVESTYIVSGEHYVGDRITF